MSFIITPCFAACHVCFKICLLPPLSSAFVILGFLLYLLAPLLLFSRPPSTCASLAIRLDKSLLHQANSAKPELPYSFLRFPEQPNICGIWSLVYYIHYVIAHCRLSAHFSHFCLVLLPFSFPRAILSIYRAHASLCFYYSFLLLTSAFLLVFLRLRFPVLLTFIESTICHERENGCHSSISQNCEKMGRGAGDPHIHSTLQEKGRCVHSTPRSRRPRR